MANAKGRRRLQRAQEKAIEKGLDAVREAVGRTEDKSADRRAKRAEKEKDDNRKRNARTLLAEAIVVAGTIGVQQIDMKSSVALAIAILVSGTYVSVLIYGWPRIRRRKLAAALVAPIFACSFYLPFEFVVEQRNVIEKFKEPAFVSREIVLGDHRPADITVGDGCPGRAPCFSFRVGRTGDGRVSVNIGAFIDEDDLLIYGPLAEGPRFPNKKGCWQEISWSKYRYRLLVEDDSPSHTTVWAGIADGYISVREIQMFGGCGIDAMKETFGISS